MKREGMPAQRLEGKRVEECVGEGETEREREKERMHVGERERDRTRFGSSFYKYFLPPGLPCANWAQPGVLFVLPEVFTLVLGPSFVLFLGAFPLLVF